MEKICIGLALFVIMQAIKPTKMEVKGFVGIGLFLMTLWGLGALATMLYNTIQPVLK